MLNALESAPVKDWECLLESIQQVLCLEAIESLITIESPFRTKIWSVTLSVPTPSGLLSWLRAQENLKWTRCSYSEAKQFQQHVFKAQRCKMYKENATSFEKRNVWFASGESKRDQQYVWSI